MVTTMKRQKREEGGDSVLLHGLKEDPDFRHVESRLLVSCPAGGTDEGGLFYLDFDKNELKKLYAGTCSGMAWAGERLIVATDDNHILALDRRFRLVSKTKYGKLDFHGVSGWSDSHVLIVETATNTVGCYEVETFRRTGEIRFHASDKDVHHLNDVWLEGHTLYVSMFSPYDRWYLDPTGKHGAIVAVDLTEFRPDGSLVVEPAEHIVTGGLYMPHTVTVRNGRLAYCDSMTFRAVVEGDGENETAIQLPGFTRGLAFAERTIFIGQSRMRHVLRIPHEFSNCSLDGGIYVYHPEYRISRFVPLPAQQVYQILVVDAEPSPGG